MPQIIECIPNFSQGADLALVEDIVAAIKTAKVLNVHSDADHNRSVVTILGEPLAVIQAAFDLTQRAMQLLDVREHVGEHPFIGVMDVIPFVPLQEITPGEVCQMAAQLGERLWKELQLPVYLYGAAARQVPRRELPYVRRGGYAALQKEINLPERQPDIGHGLHVTAGATAVGVRDFLIAFNVNLATSDIDIARSIAKNIREKSGGLPGVRALGIQIKRGSRVALPAGRQEPALTQVTINVVDYRQTSLEKVFTEVQKWATEYRVEILNSELVGMIPKDAVVPGMKEKLQIINFSETLILDKIVLQ